MGKKPLNINNFNDNDNDSNGDSGSDSYSYSMILKTMMIKTIILNCVMWFHLLAVNSMGSTTMKPIKLELKIPQTEATNTSQNVTIEAIVLGILTTESTIISKQTLLPSTILRIVPTYSTNISEKTTSQSTILGIVPTDTRTVSQQVTSKATVREADQSQTSTIAITSTKVTTSLPQTQHVTSLNKEGTTVNTHTSYSFTTNDITVSPVTPGVTTSKVKKNLVFDTRQSTNYGLGLYLIICASVPSALLLISIAVFCAIYHKKVKSSKWQKGSSEEILERQETRYFFIYFVDINYRL